MTHLAPPVAAALATLLADSERSRVVELDAIAEALGMTVSVDDIERVLATLERHKRRIITPVGERPPVEALRVVLRAARELSAELGRTPRVDEIAPRADETPRGVRRALLYARVLVR